MKKPILIVLAVAVLVFIAYKMGSKKQVVTVKAEPVTGKPNLGDTTKPAGPAGGGTIPVAIERSGSLGYGSGFTSAGAVQFNGQYAG